jgi:hypothetical protein
MPADSTLMVRAESIRQQRPICTAPHAEPKSYLDFLVLLRAASVARGSVRRQLVYGAARTVRVPAVRMPLQIFDFAFTRSLILCTQ